ncbi:MAG TPA: response regulator [Candidatus Acidoferrum sp.]|nr:response regulator [Candidatus Acidoferrum sp.]
MHERATILVVEDDANDLFFLKRAFTALQKQCDMQAVGDGAEAIDYLRGVDDYSDRDRFPLPALILMDLKMPRVDGFEFLAWLRREPGLKIIPVVVFSSSNLPEDVRRAYELGANSFIVKLDDNTTLPQTLRTLASYWLDVCETPIGSLISAAV